MVDDPPPARHPGGRAYRARWPEARLQLLVVDPHTDDGTLGVALAGWGIEVTWVGSTLAGLLTFGKMAPRAVLVAADAPGISPDEFVRMIREQGSPHVLAGVPDAAGVAVEDDEGRAADVGAAAVGSLLVAGASGVVTRPYAAEQLWRLLAGVSRAAVEHARLVVGPLELDAAAFTVRVRGVRIRDLPLKEFALLRALMLAAPGVVSDDELREAVWGPDLRRPRGNTIAMHVTRLRGRLREVAVVRRVRGRGYSLVVEDQSRTSLRIS